MAESMTISRTSPGCVLPDQLPGVMLLVQLFS